MARDVDYNDPQSWDDDDKTWLRDRIERVPAEHRHHLVDNPPMQPPAGEAVSPELDRLRTFLEKHYPEDMMVEGQTPVGLAIQLLSDAAGVDPDDISDDDSANTNYDRWKAAELTEEIGKRRQAGREIPKVTNKTEAAAALAADDATNGPFKA